MPKVEGLFPNGNPDSFFRKEKDKVVRYLIKTYGLSKEEAIDCYQEGCYGLWKNCISGKLTKATLTCGLSTYLISCCRNHATHILEKKGRTVDKDDPFSTIGSRGDDDERGVSGELVIDEHLLILEKAVKALREPCYTILWNYYFNYEEVKEAAMEKETVLDVIALMLGIKKTTLKVRKMRCIDKLKKTVKSMANI